MDKVGEIIKEGLQTFQRVTNNRSMGMVHIPKHCIFIYQGNVEKMGENLFSIIL